MSSPRRTVDRDAERVYQRRTHRRLPAMVAERARVLREPISVSVDCPRCGVFLADVGPGVECYCGACGAWTPSTAVPTTEGEGP